jgi:hypothetical protein
MSKSSSRYEQYLATAVQYLIDEQNVSSAKDLSECEITGIDNGTKLTPGEPYDEIEAWYPTFEVELGMPRRIFDEFANESEEFTPELVADIYRAFKAVFSPKEILIINPKLRLLNVEQNWRKRMFSDEEIYSPNINELEKSVFGKPLITPQFQSDIFMVMPFRPKLNEIYNTTIKSVAEELKLVIKRGDDFSSPQGFIMSEIWSAICACKLVIAEYTAVAGEINGNVYYEIGIADTIGKPVIFLTQTLEKMPFDVRHRRLIYYENSIPGGKKLHEDLKKMVERMMKDSEV